MAEPIDTGVPPTTTSERVYRGVIPIVLLPTMPVSLVTPHAAAKTATVAIPQSNELVYPVNVGAAGVSPVKTCVVMPVNSQLMAKPERTADQPDINENTLPAALCCQQTGGSSVHQPDISSSCFVSQAVKNNDAEALMMRDQRADDRAPAYYS